MKIRCIAEGSLRIIFCFKLKVKDGMETKYNLLLFFKKKNGEYLFVKVSLIIK